MLKQIELFIIKSVFAIFFLMIFVSFCNFWNLIFYYFLKIIANCYVFFLFKSLVLETQTVEIHFLQSALSISRMVRPIVSKFRVY